jgi:hypothetical protein
MDGIDRDERGAVSFSLRPVVPDGRRSRPGARLAVAVVVVAIAFLGGVALGGSGRRGEAVVPQPTATSTPSPTADTAAADTPSLPAGDSPAPTWTVPPVTPGTSEFARTFDPLALIAALSEGRGCSGGVAGEGDSDTAPNTDGIREFARGWLTSCRLPLSHRAAFVTRLIPAIGGAMPSTGYSWTIDDNGRAFAVIPYRQSDFAGTVTVASVETKVGVDLAITLVERAAQQPVTY